MEGSIGTVVLLPGVPREMRGLLVNEVVPRVKQRAGDLVIQSTTLRTAGISESALADALQGVEEQIAPLTLAFLPSAEAGVDLRLTAWRLPRVEAEERLTAAVARLEPLLGKNQYHGVSLAEQLLTTLRKKGLTVAVAESCTGGLVGQRLTEIPGCSDVFLGGVVAYANDAKENLLGVPHALLERHGAVSAEVAMAMAEGALQRFKADTSVAVTGIAGPGGGTADKPVGTVHLAARVHDKAVHRAFVLPGDREDIRQRSAVRVLDLLRRTLS
jgi:nicotinamide-nucleotide amidase